MSSRHKQFHNISRIFFIITAVILVWRGAWGLLDIFLFPDNLLVSYIASLGTGLIILIAADKLADAFF